LAHYNENGLLNRGRYYTTSHFPLQSTVMPKASPPPVKFKKCRICRALFRTQGYKAHVKKCEWDRQLRREARRRAKALEERFGREDILDEPLGLPEASTATEPKDLNVGSGTSQTAGPSGGAEAHTFTVLDHPNNGRATETQLLDGHSRKPSSSRNPEPWSPFFKSREDFEISEILLKAGTAEGDFERLIKIFKRCLDGKGSFNITKYSDVRRAWKRASSQLTPTTQ